MAPENELNSFRGILPFLVLFFSIVLLFILLAHFVPLQQEFGWSWIVLFLFLFFVGEPLYRRRTDRYEYHILLLEIYIFGAYFVQLFFPAANYSHLFYVIPIFSGALSFGLLGTMGTAFFAFLLEILRVAPLWELRPDHFQQVLPDILPLVILALLLGFTVEVKNYTQQQLLNRLARMDAFRGLKNIIDVGQRRQPFTAELLNSVIELTEASAGLVENIEKNSIVVSSGFDGGISDFQKSLHEGEQFYKDNKIYRIDLPWDGGDYLLALLGGNLHGILLAAEEEMVRALATYLHHFIDYLRVQREKENSARLRETLIETVPLGIIVTDQQGRIEEFNRAASQMLGLGEEQALASDIREILNLGGQKLELEDTRCEIVIGGPDGEIPADISIRRARLGEEDKWLLVISDLRPLKELQQKAERRRRMLALGEMAAGLAHEIRNPLGSLAGFVSLLEENAEVVDREEIKRLTGKIRRSYRRINRLIEQFIQYAREPEKIGEQFYPVELVERIVDSIELPPHIDLRFNCVLSGEIFLYGDYRRLEMAIRNIILNARQAPGCDMIDVEIEKSGNDQLVITVSDNGAGIKQELQDKVFDPFVTSKKEGMGLGLALAQRVFSEEFGGRIEINSEPEKGTEVKIILPANKEAQ